MNGLNFVIVQASLGRRQSYRAPVAACARLVWPISRLIAALTWNETCSCLRGRKRHAVELNGGSLLHLISASHGAATPCACRRKRNAAPFDCGWRVAIEIEAVQRGAACLWNSWPVLFSLKSARLEREGNRLQLSSGGRPRWGEGISELVAIVIVL